MTFEFIRNRHGGKGTEVSSVCMQQSERALVGVTRIRDQLMLGLTHDSALNITYDGDGWYGEKGENRQLWTIYNAHSGAVVGWAYDGDTCDLEEFFGIANALERFGKP